MTLPRALRPDSLWRRRDGVAAIEFAITAPLVVMLVMVLLEIGYLLGGGLLLDAGARAAGRFALTGQTVAGETRVQSIRRIITSYVCPRDLAGGAGGYCFWSAGTTSRSDDGIDSPLQITAKVYASPANIGQPEPYSDTKPANGRYDPGESYTDVNGNGRWDADMAASGSGGAGDFVLYEVRMPEDVRNPLFRLVMPGGVLWQRASLAVRNENF